MPYETLGVSHFNGFFCQLLEILAEKKDVFFSHPEGVLTMKHGDRSEKPWLIGYESSWFLQSDWQPVGDYNKLHLGPIHELTSIS